MEAVMTAIIALIIIALIKGWAFMVALGILGVSVAFWPATAAAFLLTLALGFTASVKS